MRPFLKKPLAFVILSTSILTAQAADIPVIASPAKIDTAVSPATQIEPATVGGWLAKQADPSIDPLPADAISVVATQGIMGSALSTLGVVALIGVAAKLVIQHEQRTLAQEKQNEINRRLEMMPLYAPLPVRANDFGNARHDYR